MLIMVKSSPSISPLLQCSLLPLPVIVMFPSPPSIPSPGKKCLSGKCAPVYQHFSEQSSVAVVSAVTLLLGIGNNSRSPELGSLRRPVVAVCHNPSPAFPVHVIYYPRERWLNIVNTSMKHNTNEINLFILTPLSYERSFSTEVPIF